MESVTPGETSQQIRLSDLKNQFYVAIPTMKDDILSELKGKGMYSVDPESAHVYVVAGVVITAAAVRDPRSCWVGDRWWTRRDCWSQRHLLPW